MTNEKGLEEHTVAELKEIARETGKIDGISAMKKAELIDAIKATQDGATEKPPSEPAGDTTPKEEKASRKPGKKTEKKPEKGMETISSLKGKSGELKEKKAGLREQGDKKGADRLRRRMNRLKKKTRKLAKAVSA
jgi:transcription termination factor Rho